MEKKKKKVEVKNKDERDQDRAFDAMAEAIGRYIKAMGGAAVVVGGVGIGQKPGARKYNYFIQVDFTGTPPSWGLHRTTRS